MIILQEVDKNANKIVSICKEMVAQWKCAAVAKPFTVNMNMRTWNYRAIWIGMV